MQPGQPPQPPAQPPTPQQQQGGPGGPPPGQFPPQGAPFVSGPPPPQQQQQQMQQMQQQPNSQQPPMMQPGPPRPPQQGFGPPPGGFPSGGPPPPQSQGGGGGFAGGGAGGGATPPGGYPNALAPPHMQPPQFQQQQPRPPPSPQLPQPPPHIQSGVPGQQQQPNFPVPQFPQGPPPPGQPQFQQGPPPPGSPPPNFQQRPQLPPGAPQFQQGPPGQANFQPPPQPQQQQGPPPQQPQQQGPPPPPNSSQPPPPRPPMPPQPNSSLPRPPAQPNTPPVSQTQPPNTNNNNTANNFQQQLRPASAPIPAAPTPQQSAPPTPQQQQSQYQAAVAAFASLPSQPEFRGGLNRSNSNNNTGSGTSGRVTPPGQVRPSPLHQSGSASQSTQQLPHVPGVEKRPGAGGRVGPGAGDPLVSQPQGANGSLQPMSLQQREQVAQHLQTVGGGQGNNASIGAAGAIGSDVQELQRLLAEAKAENHRLQDDKSVLQEKMRRLAQKGGEPTNASVPDDRELKDMKQQVADLQASLATAGAREEETLRRFKEQTEDYQRQLAVSQAQANRNNSAPLERNVSSLHAQIEGLKRQLAASSLPETQAVDVRVSGLRQQLIGLSEQAALERNELVQIRNKLTQSETERIELRSKCEELNALSHDLVHELESTTRDLHAAIARGARGEEHLTATTAAQIEEARVRAEIAATRLQLAQAEMEKRNNQLASLRGMLDEIAGLPSRAGDTVDFSEQFISCCSSAKELREKLLRLAEDKDMLQEEATKLRATQINQRLSASVRTLEPPPRKITFNASSQTDGSNNASGIMVKPMSPIRTRKSNGGIPLAVEETERQEILSSSDACHPMNLQIDWERPLGVGVFSDVYRGVRQVGVAVKAFRGQFQDRLFDAFIREALILRRLSHPNIVRFAGVCVNVPELHLLMEIVDGPSLLEIMHERQIHLSLAQVIAHAIELASALEYIHSLHVVHCDVKPSNLLVDQQNRLKLIDFGLARDADANGQVIVVRLGGVQEGGGGGTPAYQPPEALLGEPIGSKVDVFGFAVCVWEMLSGELPWCTHELQNMKLAVIRGDRPPMPSRTPPALGEWIQRCWATAAADRPMMADVHSSLVQLRVQGVLPSLSGMM